MRNYPMLHAIKLPFGEFPTEWCNTDEMKVISYSPFYGWYSYFNEEL